jgi:hypothetical protein
MKIEYIVIYAHEIIDLSIVKVRTDVKQSKSING